MINSVYIHIPFCKNICSYCDFPKVFCNDYWINKYLEMLKKEITLKYKNDLIKTIYIGGGTPSSLNIKQLKKLFDIIKLFNLDDDVEITFECNLDSLTIEKLNLLKENHINRLSIGIETFDKKALKFLNRDISNISLIKKAKKLGFKNINIDLIYALPNENIKDLKKDLDMFLSLDIEHISLYSLILEKNTKLFNKNVLPIDQELDLKMYELICKVLKKNGYNHYEISNFSKTGYESRHNLAYWDNKEYYGFGMGASGYIGNIRYTNTKSITNYLNGKLEFERELVTDKQLMEYEMILGLRKLKGVCISNFEKKYQKKIEDVFSIKKLIEEGKLIIEDDYIKIPEKYLYISNSILINFIGD